MAEFLKSECARCGQPIEYPAAGTGQTVPCPACGEPLVLTPPKRLAAVDSPSSPAPLPPRAPAPSLPAAGTATPAAPPKTKSLPPLDQAYAEFANDPAFAGRLPTREQVARAWALAIYNRHTGSRTPTHLELVAALRKLFNEFKEPKPVSNRPPLRR